MTAPTCARSVLALALAAVLAAGCSDSTAPPPGADDGSRDFQGAIDPSGKSFLLKSIDSTTTGGVSIRVDLVGSNLQVNVTDSNPEIWIVSLNVAVRNAGNVSLFAPGEIVIFDLDPSTIFARADREECPPRMSPILDSRGCLFTYDYSALLGDDGILESGETSGAKRWEFRMLTLTAFSFGATARFGITPDRPRIEGIVFGDRNENGRRDPDEPGFGGGTVTVNGPGIDSLWVAVPEDGRYVVPVKESGLYTLLAVPPPTFVAVRSTTPNPLQVLIVPGPDGRPESYLHADFGFTTDLTPPPPPPPDSLGVVGFWDGPLDSLELDPYALLALGAEGTDLHLKIGYSGCSPDHPFALFMVGGFMESNPVQVTLVLSHDDRGELCDAYFMKALGYDLSPILRRYREVYGREDVIVVNFRASNGEVHSFRIGPVTTDNR